jgi:hypothetical protein
MTDSAGTKWRIHRRRDHPSAARSPGWALRDASFLAQKSHRAHTHHTTSRYRILYRSRATPANLAALQSVVGAVYAQETARELNMETPTARNQRGKG